MEVVATAIRYAKLQSNCHQQQTNTQLFTGWMPCLMPNRLCQCTEGNVSHCTDLLTPSSPGSLPTLSLTTRGPWLPFWQVCHASHQPADPGTLTRHIKATMYKK